MDAKGATTRLTNVNAQMLGALDPVNYQKFDFAGANGDRVYGQIVKPEGAKGKIITRNLRNSVFVDITANADDAGAVKKLGFSFSGAGKRDLVAL